MSDDPYEVIKRLTKSLQQQQKDNAALLKKVARQKKQIAARDSTISKLEKQQSAMAEHVRTAFATATAYVAAELPKELETVLDQGSLAGRLGAATGAGSRTKTKG